MNDEVMKGICQFQKNELTNDAVADDFWDQILRFPISDCFGEILGPEDLKKTPISLPPLEGPLTLVTVRVTVIGKDGMPRYG